MGVSPVLAHGALRATVGRDTGEDDVDRFIEALVESVEELRRISGFC